MKKTFIAFSLFAIAFITSVAHAQGFVPLAEIPGLTQGITANQAGLANFLNNLYKYLIGLAAALAVVEIIWGGLEISTQDSVSKKSDGKQRIYNAIFGLVLILSPVLVFTIINPSILNLSINLTPLKTTPGAGGAGSGGSGGPPTVDTTTNCSVSGTGGILQIAVCPSPETARIWGQGCTAGNLSSVTNLNSTDPSNGVATTKSVVTCTIRQRYRFIDPGGTFTSISTAVNRLRPLVSTPNNQQNGSGAVSFAAACTSAGVGWKTCISDAPLITMAVPCELTGSSANTTWKCYDEELSCINLTNPTSRGLCTDTPSWTPFQ